MNMAQILEFSRPVPARIFNVDFCERLATMNSVARNLKKMGYRILSEEALPDMFSKPLVMIEGSSDMRSLLKYARNRSWQNRNGKRFCYVEILGVITGWEEKHEHACI